MDDSHRNPLQEADAIQTIAGRGELTTKQVEPDPEA